MRKSVSRSAVTLSAAEIEQEFGNEVHRIEAKIGDTTLRFDPEQSVWLFGSSKFKNEHFSPSSSRLEKNDEIQVDANELVTLQQKKQDLHTENQQLAAKIEMLLEMLATIHAEKDLRQERK